MSDLIVISVPKAGTMLLGQMLESLTPMRMVFGLADPGPATLRRRFEAAVAGNHPCLAHLQDDIEPKKIARRYGLMIAKNRKAGGFFVDHGTQSFPELLLNPSANDILHPDDVSHLVGRPDSQIVYLYRGLGDIARSFAQFLASGKSYLLSAKCVESAKDAVVDHYLPVIARQIAIWTHTAHQQVVPLLYEDLIAEPNQSMARIFAGTVHQSSSAEIADALGRKSWTYNSKRSDWRDYLGQERSAKVDALARSEGVAHV